jgi:hypothetical protein
MSLEPHKSTLGEDSPEALAYKAERQRRQSKRTTRAWRAKQVKTPKRRLSDRAEAVLAALTNEGAAIAALVEQARQAPAFKGVKDKSRHQRTWDAVNELRQAGLAEVTKVQGPRLPIAMVRRTAQPCDHGSIRKLRDAKVAP